MTTAGPAGMKQHACRRCQLRPGLPTVITLRMRAVDPHVDGRPLYTPAERWCRLCGVCNRGLNEATLPRAVRLARR